MAVISIVGAICLLVFAARVIGALLPFVAFCLVFTLVMAAIAFFTKKKPRQ